VGRDTTASSPLTGEARIVSATLSWT
jgi:hypothetical protein